MYYGGYMPRTARLDAPGVLHHIMIPGIERRRIFLSAKDREDFLDRIAKLLSETKTACCECLGHRVLSQKR